MSRLSRLIPVLALLLLVPVAACGGSAEEAAEDAANQAEEAAEDAADAMEEAAEEAADTMEEMGEQAEEMMEEEAPAEPELVGNIQISGENLEWGTPTEETAPYTWTVRVNNDTTATLDITVSFQLLDSNDGVIKTETATVRLQPAQSTTIREDGSLPYDQANNVYSYSSTYDYSIVES